MNTPEVIQQLLSIQKPWKVSRVEFDDDNFFNIWLSYEDTSGLSQLFNTKKNIYCKHCALKSDNQFLKKDISWVHTNIGDYSTKIHTSFPVYAAPCKRSDCSLKKPWLGGSKLKITYGIAHKIVELLSKGIPFSVICRDFKIPVETAWLVKQQFDNGSLSMRKDRQAAKTNAPAISDDATTGIPEAESNIWLQLLDKDSQFKTNSLNLSLFLTKIRGQVKNMQDEESTRFKINELRHFFIKNQRTLSREIEQLTSINSL